MIFKLISFRSAVNVLMVLTLFSGAAPSESKAAAGPSDTQAVQKRLAEGIRLGKDGEYQQAIAELKEVLKLDPKNVHALNNIAVAYFKLNDQDQAISYYTKAIDLGVADARTYFSRGVIFGKHRNQHAKAVKDYSKAIKLQPKYARAYLNRAQSYLSLKNYGQAVADYDAMVRIDPKNLKTVIGKRAAAYYKKGDYAKAQADVEKAKELGVKVDKMLIADIEKAMKQKQAGS